MLAVLLNFCQLAPEVQNQISKNLSFNIMVHGYYSYLAYYKYQRLEILAKKPYSKQEHLEQNVSCAKHINSAVDGKGWYYRKAAEAEECLFPVGRQLRDCLNGSTRNSILSSAVCTHWTIYSATTFLESCRKVVREKWFKKSGSKNLVP